MASIRASSSKSTSLSQDKRFGGRRGAPKRRIVSDDEDDSPQPSLSRANSGILPENHPIDIESSMDVDVEYSQSQDGDGAGPSEDNFSINSSQKRRRIAHSDDESEAEEPPASQTRERSPRRNAHKSHSSTSQLTDLDKHTRRRKAKKRREETPDEDDDDDETQFYPSADEGNVAKVDEEPDSDFIEDDTPRRPTKKKAPSKSKSGKPLAKAAKKTNAEPKARDTRQKKVAPSQDSIEGQPQKRQRGKAKPTTSLDTSSKIPTNEEEMRVDVTGDDKPDMVPTEDSANQEAPPSSPKPITTKPKFPTIKKYKAADGASSSGKPSPAPKTSAAVPITKTTNAPTKRLLPGEVPDLDLRNSKVYEDLFKPTNRVATVATGGRTTAERRKELDAMRDAAKAKRIAEQRHTFDLQAQCEKILRFEQRLKCHERSAALYPNCLAAKWKGEFELEKKRLRSAANGLAPNNVKEEGELR